MPDYVAMARAAARRAGIDPDLFVRQINQESGFAEDVITGRRSSSAGAQGIAQIVRKYHPNVDPLDPAAALDYAATWMSQLLKQYGGDWAKALAVYNGGVGALNQLQAGRPYDETRQYLTSILGGMGPRVAEAAELDQAAPGGAGEMDRPPSSFEPPSRYGGSPATGAANRSSRMAGRVTDLQRQRSEIQARIEALLKPGPDETPADPGERVNPVFEAQAAQARHNRELELAHWRAQLGQVDTALRQTENDLSNDPDPKGTQPKDPMQAEADRLAVEKAAFDLAEAKRKANAAASPEEKRLAELEVRKAELGVQQAELNLERTRNPAPPQRAPRYPDEIAASEASAAANRATAARTSALTPLEVEQAQLENAGKRQDLLPKQQQVLQGHLETVKFVQGMLERNEIDQAQADAYIAASKAAAMGVLRGASPFQEMKEKREAEQASQRMGTDLLTQRLSSGAGLASSLLSSATSLAGHAMLRPGQTSLGVDPLAQLMPILSQLQGGSDITPFARSLLMGAQQGPPGVPGPLPAGL